MLTRTFKFTHEPDNDQFVVSLLDAKGEQYREVGLIFPAYDDRLWFMPFQGWHFNPDELALIASFMEEKEDELSLTNCVLTQTGLIDLR